MVCIVVKDEDSYAFETRATRHSFYPKRLPVSHESGRLPQGRFPVAPGASRVRPHSALNSLSPAHVRGLPLALSSNQR